MAAGGDSIFTAYLRADRGCDVDHAARLLRAGRLVAMPTETVYGLAANALDSIAVECIFAAKERPHWDPLIVHLCNESMLKSVVRGVTPVAQKLMDTFWPGPLTLLLPRHPALPAAVTAGRDLVGVRMPAHPIAQALIRAAAMPLAAPSANRFGHISPTTAQHVLADLDGRIDAVLDAGSCRIGVESTVFDPACGVLYRQGGISANDLERVTEKPVQSYVPPAAGQDTQPDSLPSPGVGIRHYAPRARVLLVRDQQELQSALSQYGHHTTGVLLPQGWSLPEVSGPVFSWAQWDDTASLARHLYAGLRTLDSANVEIILCPLPNGNSSLAQAVRDRLQKAAKV